MNTNPPPAILRCNGAPADTVAATSRGLLYGDGVFRTLLLRAGRIDAEDRQIERLIDDARRLALRPPAPERLARELDAVRPLGDGVVKLLLVRAGRRRGYAPDTEDADLLVQAWAGAPPIDDRPLHALRSPITLGSQPHLAGVKHLNRLDQVIASRDWPPGIGEAILGLSDGGPVCGTRANLFWLRDGRLFTPALNRAGVAGVTRDRVLAAAVAASLPVDVLDAPSWAALMAADEAFVCSSLLGVRSLASIDGHAFAPPTPRLARLIAAVGHPSNAVPDACR